MKAVYYFLLLAGFIVVNACNNKTSLKESRPENIISVERNAEAYTVKIKSKGSRNVFQGSSVASISWANPTHISGGDSITIPHKYPENRMFFATKKQNNGDTLYMSERHIPMEGTPNFRELGGIINKEGKQIRWGQFFRSGSLENLTDNDLIYFNKLGIKKIIDLRTDEEIASAPDRIADSSIQWQQVRIINPSDMKGALTSSAELNAETASAFLVESNKNFVLNIKRFQPVFDALENDEPFLFHCTAGKDRTGMAAALILMVLNVDREVIMDDYLLTNRYTIPYYEKNKDKMAQLGFTDAIIKELGGVKREYLQAAFNTIDSLYGSSEVMLQTEFGITPEKQKELVKRYTY